MNLNRATRLYVGSKLSSAIVETDSVSNFYAHTPLLISKIITGNRSLNKYGADTLTISSNNTYTGKSYINSGTLILASDSNTLGSGPVYFSSGTTLKTATATSLNNNIYLYSGSLTLEVTSGNLGIYGNLYGSGIITQSSALSAPVRNVIFSGDNSNFSGTFFEDNNTQNRTSFNSPTAGSDSAIWRFDRNIAGGAAINLLNGGIINFGQITGGGRTNGGGLRINTTGTTIKIGALNTNSTFAGVIQQGNINTSGSIIKTGNGTFTLSNLNTYNGKTTITGGALYIVNTGSFPINPSNKLSSALLTSTDSITFTFGTAPIIGESYRILSGITTNTYTNITFVNGGGRTGSYNSLNSTLTIA
jgi:autotransporter-associated beta strand protein